MEPTSVTQATSPTKMFQESLLDGISSVESHKPAEPLLSISPPIVNHHTDAARGVENELINHLVASLEALSKTSPEGIEGGEGFDLKGNGDVPSQPPSPTEVVQFDFSPADTISREHSTDCLIHAVQNLALGNGIKPATGGLGQRYAIHASAWAHNNTTSPLNHHTRVTNNTLASTGGLNSLASSYNTNNGSTSTAAAVAAANGFASLSGGASLQHTAQTLSQDNSPLRLSQPHTVGQHGHHASSNILDSSSALTQFLQNGASQPSTEPVAADMQQQQQHPPGVTLQGNTHMGGVEMYGDKAYLRVSRTGKVYMQQGPYISCNRNNNSNSNHALQAMHQMQVHTANAGGVIGSNHTITNNAIMVQQHMNGLGTYPHHTQQRQHHHAVGMNAGIPRSISPQNMNGQYNLMTPSLYNMQHMNGHMAVRLQDPRFLGALNTTTGMMVTGLNDTTTNINHQLMHPMQQQQQSLFPEECLVGLAGQYQPYCDQIITDELNQLTFQLLLRVKVLQLADSPAVSHILGKRYFCSLKEVSKVIPCAKALIIAPDVRPSPTAHIKPVGLLQSVVRTAQASGVPYVFALSRRGIGQVFGRDKNMSIVAVMQTEGVEAEFIQMLDLAAHGREMYRAHRTRRY